MIDAYYFVLVSFTVVVGVALVTAGLFKKRLNPLALIAITGVEAGLVIQLIISLILMASGDGARTDNFQFFAYLLFALVIPVASGLWAIAEPSHHSMVALGFGSLTISVMLFRMQQLW